MNSQIKYTLLKCSLGAILLLLKPCIFSNDLNAQGISINNTPTPANQAAMLDISSGSVAPVGNMGWLIPRVNFAQRMGNFNPLPAAAQGLMVYQTDVGTLGEGLYYNTSTTTTPNWVKAGASGWGVDGNTGTFPGTNMLGTTDGAGLDFRTNNTIRMSVLSGGNVGIGGTAPGVKLAVGGNGGDVYATDSWIENNIHAQGPEAVGAGRGRLRVGTKWNYVGLYAEPNSLTVNNDLVVGSSSGTVRIGPGGALKLLLPASTGFQMVNNAANDRLLVSDASGNGNWQDLSTVMQVYTATASQTLINSVAWVNITGLSQTVVLTNTSYVIIKTRGSLEYQGGAGSCTGTITSLAQDGVSLQEQGHDFANDGFVPVPQLDKSWSITHTMTLAPGTYTFSVRARYYFGIGTLNFYAGGATPTGGTNNGSLVIRVIPQ